MMNQVKSHREIYEIIYSRYKEILMVHLNYTEDQASRASNIVAVKETARLYNAQFYRK